MNITGDTKLLDLMDQYPWLKEEAMKLSPEIKKVDTPIGRMFLKKATISDVSKRAGIPEEEIITWISDMIATYEQQD